MDSFGEWSRLTMKYIIYYDKYFNNWCVTAEINYLRGLRSHRTHCVNGEKMNFDTPEEFRDFLISKGYGGVNDYIIERSMSQRVIFYDKFYNCWCMTTKTNYIKHIRDKRCIIRFKRFKTPEDIIKFYVKSGYGEEEKYTVIQKTESS